MKFLSLVWRNLLRRKTRTICTLLAIIVMFVLYGMLMTLRTSFDLGVQLAGEDRLMLMSKVSLIQLLPISYMQQIQSTPGVTLVTHNTWFGGTYQDNANAFAVIAVEPEKYLEIYPEFKVPPDQVKAFAADRQGALVGKDVAARYGWKIGDKIPIRATIWQPKEGQTWYFNVDAIYDGDKTIDKTNFFFHYDYLDENRRGAYGQVGWYVIRINDTARSADISRAIDAQFENSSAETKTGTEKSFVQGFAAQFGNIGLITMEVAAVALLMILVIVGNTMTQSVRERTSELAVLKTLGFSNTLVLTLVMLESLSLGLLGGGMGIGLAWLFVTVVGDPTHGALPVFILRGHDVLLGVGLAALLGALAGVLPAMAAMRLRITDALRRN